MAERVGFVPHEPTSLNGLDRIGTARSSGNPSIRDSARSTIAGPDELKAVLDADFTRVLRDGLLAPGAGGGVVIGVHMHDERRVFACGSATAASIFEIGSVTKPITALALARFTAERGPREARAWPTRNEDAHIVVLCSPTQVAFTH
jgi:CubicO group peptidase (beta-lactamase class C family)